MRPVVFRDRRVDTLDPIVRAARNGARVLTDPRRLREVYASNERRAELEAADQKRQDEERAMAAWLSSNKPKKLRKGRANAPPISKIRQAIKSGQEYAVRRSGGRTVVYNPASEGGDSQAAREHPRAAAPPRRRRRRSAQKPPA